MKKKCKKSNGVEKKSEIVLIQSAIDKMSEDEIRELLLQLTNENKEIKDVYYSLNTSVLKTRQRSFSELTRKFIDQIEEILCENIDNKIVKYKH